MNRHIAGMCHIAFWAFLFFSPLTYWRGTGITLPHYLMICMQPAMTLFIFYLNYIYLAPKFFVPGKHRYDLLINLVLVFFLGITLHHWMNITNEIFIPGFKGEYNPLNTISYVLRDSINFAMTPTATGGFATHNDSTAYFQSPAIDYVAVLFQFLAGINFAMLYMAIFKMKVAELLKSSEFKLYVFIVSAATLLITFLLISRNGYGIEHAFRSSLFQVVSFITTTGLFNDDVAMWPHITWVILGCLMFIGACSGSTTGGFKCIRGVMVFKVLRNEFRKILHPNAVLPVKLNGQTVSQQKLSTLLAFFAIYTVMVLLSATIMIVAGIDNTNAITIALSCMSNVGASLDNQIGPAMSWGELPDYIKWTCSFLMLVGRLEIMSVLVLFTRAFWRDN